MNRKTNNLIPYTADCFGKTYHVCLTAELFEEWKNYPTCLGLLIHHGMKLLQRPSPADLSACGHAQADDIHCKERVVVRNQVLVIEDWEGRIIFLKPQEMVDPHERRHNPCTTC